MNEFAKVKFSDMAYQITTKVNPKETSLTTYVGLEHLDPDSLKIKRHGTPQDVIGEKLRVSKGDIIFGKRRVYQRKVAIADFDGICSAHAMVLRPKEDVMSKDFFPFFMQSNQFMERALQISVGSLSPTINWKTLAEEEFFIPTVSEQRRIAIILWAAEDCIIKGERFVAAAERAKQVLMRELFSKGIGHSEFKEVKGFGKIPKNWELTKMKEIAEVRGRIGWRGLTTEDYVDEGPILLGVRNILPTGSLDLSDLTRIPLKKYEESPEIMVQKDDVLLAKTGATIGKSCVVKNIQEPMTVNAAVNILRPKQGVDSNFLNYLVSSEYLQKQMQLTISDSARGNLFQKDINNFIIVYPPIGEQHQIVNILTRCDETISAARANVEATRAMKMRLINEMLTPEN